MLSIARVLTLVPVWVTLAVVIRTLTDRDPLGMMGFGHVVLSSLAVGMEASRDRAYANRRCHHSV